MKEGKSSAVKSVAQAIPPRPPVVAVMGHVDHGKTTLLDKIRKTQVAAGEVGGISQRLTASQVLFQNKRITFIDTPGHEAFMKMRSRGGQVADIVLLVVSAAEGVKPQTREALSLIRASKLPLIVVLTKVDLPEADVQRVKEELTKEGVLLEGFGGDTVCLEVSGVTGVGIEALLEMILLMAAMLELKADTSASFSGVIIESRLDPKKGPVALVVATQGQLKIGQAIQAGEVSGKVRSLTSSSGERCSLVSPGEAAEILGLSKVPGVGETVTLIPDKGHERPHTPAQLPAMAATPVTPGPIINLILRADSLGMIEALQGSLGRFNEGKQRLNFIYLGSGDVTVSDVMLAKANQALIIAFAVRVPANVLDLAKESKITILKAEIIYQLTETIEGILKKQQLAEDSLLQGRSEVLKIFTLSSGDQVFGSRVLVGKLKVGDAVKIIHHDQPLSTAKIKSLRIKTEKVSSVPAGTECGVLLKDVADVAVHDIFEVS